MKSQSLNHPRTSEELEATAHKLAHSLGITLYIRFGAIFQHGPGQEIVPPKNACGTMHGGRFEIERTSSTPGS